MASAAASSAEVAARLLGAAAAARLAIEAPAAPAERDETDRVTARLVAAARAGNASTRWSPRARG